MADRLEFASKRVVKRKLEEESPVPTKKCKLCQEVIPKNQSSFLQHITRVHSNSPLACPFCPNSRSTWKKLLKHVQKKHQANADSFSLSDMEGASQLKDTIRQCFKKKRKGSKKTPTEETQTSLESAQKSIRCQQLEETLGKIFRTSRTAVEDPVLFYCAICGCSTESKWNHVTESHPTSGSAIPHLNETTDPSYQMFRRCFPDEDKNKCALCRKQVGSDCGRATHTTYFHHQKPLPCPYCDFTDFHHWSVSKHVKKSHPEMEELKLFRPPKQWKKEYLALRVICFPGCYSNPPSSEIDPEHLDPTPVTKSTGSSPAPARLQLHLSSKKSPGVPQSSSSGHHRRAVTCQRCHKDIDLVHGPLRHIWVSQLDNGQVMYSCSGCEARSHHSLKRLRHREHCPAHRAGVHCPHCNRRAVV